MFCWHPIFRSWPDNPGEVLALTRQHNDKLPGYVRVDAFAAYKWHVQKFPVRAQFNIRNLLDKTYY